MNHWKPDGDFFVGDCMPFFHDGVFHLYYLLDVGHHNHPVVGTRGGHQYAHAESDDLVHWRHKPIALPLDFAKGEESNCTGSFLARDGRIFVFYAQRSLNSPGESFRIAVSDDGGENFRPWGPPGPELETPPDCEGNFRDPMAFEDKDGRVHILITTLRSPEATDDPVTRVGEVAHYVTDDLVHYRREAPWLRSWPPPECCDHFFWRGKYHHAYSVDWETRFRHADNPLGPWTVPALDVPASRFCCVMKTAPWKNDRRIGVGWAPTLVDGVPVFGGRTVFRELVARPDGSLGSAFVEEMLPQRPVARLGTVDLGGVPGLDQKVIGEFDGPFRLDGEIEFSPGTREFGVILRYRPEHRWRTVSFAPGAVPDAGVVSMDRRAWVDKVSLSPKRVAFRLLRTHDILDLEIDGQRTLIAPGDAFSPASPALFVRDGAAAFRDLAVFMA